MPAKVAAGDAWSWEEVSRLHLNSICLCLTPAVRAPPPPPFPPHARSKGDGDYEVCDDFIIDDWLRQKIKASEDELIKEKECVGHLIGVEGAACRIGPGEDTMLPGEN